MVFHCLFNKIILLLCLQLNRNSHYQVPQASMKPVPPPKPVHLKVSRVSSAQEPGQRLSQVNPRKLSEADAHNRIPPPSVPPPVTCVLSLSQCWAVWTNKSIIVYSLFLLYLLNKTQACASPFEEKFSLFLKELAGTLIPDVKQYFLLSFRNRLLALGHLIQEDFQLQRRHL